MIDELKGKAADYLNEIKKKKDKLIDKAAILKSEHEETQRKKKEDWLCKKELELKEIEKELNKREELIRQKEKKLTRKFFIRFIGAAACLSAIGFFVISSLMVATKNGEHSTKKQTSDINDFVQIPATDAYKSNSRRESGVYSTYEDIDTTNPNFDVGNYCLEKEKNGGISFEECLSVAAAKIISRR